MCMYDHCQMGLGNISKVKKGTKERTKFVPSFSGEEFLF